MKMVDIYYGFELIILRRNLKKNFRSDLISSQHISVCSKSFMGADSKKRVAFVLVVINILNRRWNYRRISSSSCYSNHDDRRRDVRRQNVIKHWRSARDVAYCTCISLLRGVIYVGTRQCSRRCQRELNNWSHQSTIVGHSYGSTTDCAAV